MKDFFKIIISIIAYFISISSLVFENDKWTFGGCFGHFIMSHYLKTCVLRNTTKMANVFCFCITFKLFCQFAAFYLSIPDIQLMSQCIHNAISKRVEDLMV